MLDYYELNLDGTFELMAQTRNCIGACIDPVEAIMRRGVERLIVKAIGSSYKSRFRSSGIRVYQADSEQVEELMRSVAGERLHEIR